VKLSPPALTTVNGEMKVPSWATVQDRSHPRGFDGSWTMRSGTGSAVGVNALSSWTLHEKWLVPSHRPVATLRKNSRNEDDVVPGAAVGDTVGAAGGDTAGDPVVAPVPVGGLTVVREFGFVAAVTLVVTVVTTTGLMVETVEDGLPTADVGAESVALPSAVPAVETTSVSAVGDTSVPTTEPVVEPLAFGVGSSPPEAMSTTPRTAAAPMQMAATVRVRSLRVMVCVLRPRGEPRDSYQSC
jgi:hypothetical protein